MAAKADSDTTLRLTRDFAAPPERVFAAFLDAAVLKNIWSHEDYTIVELTVDARVGGGWKMVMRDEASGERLRCEAVYVKIDQPAHIIWKTRWLDGPLAGAPEMRVTLAFRQVGAGTRVELTHECFPDRETRDHHGAGWGSGFDRLALYLARESANGGLGKR